MASLSGYYDQTIGEWLIFGRRENNWGTWDVSVLLGSYARALFTRNIRQLSILPPQYSAYPFSKFPYYCYKCD